jgi:hypothetical protein
MGDALTGGISRNDREAQLQLQRQVQELDAKQRDERRGDGDGCKEWQGLVLHVDRNCGRTKWLCAACVRGKLDDRSPAVRQLESCSHQPPVARPGACSKTAAGAAAGGAFVDASGAFTERARRGSFGLVAIAGGERFCIDFEDADADGNARLSLAEVVAEAAHELRVPAEQVQLSYIDERGQSKGVTKDKDVAKAFRAFDRICAADGDAMPARPEFVVAVKSASGAAASATPAGSGVRAAQHLQAGAAAMAAGPASPTTRGPPLPRSRRRPRR